MKGRNSINWEEKFKYDLEYVNDLSFFMDLKVIFLTIKIVIKKEGIGEEGKDFAADYGDYLLEHKIISENEYYKKQKEAKRILEEFYGKKRVLSTKL